MSAGQARQGQVFKRCTRCNARVPERRCPKCGTRDSFTWAFVVDVTPKDARGRLIGKRQQHWAQGFPSKGAALAALNQLQAEKVAGTYVDPHRLTLGAYLNTWVTGGCGGVRPWTLKGYESAVKTHIAPRLGHVPLQSLTGMEIKAFYADLLANGYTKGSTPEQMERFADIARRWNAAGPKPTVAALARDLDRPAATVRYWVRRCHELGLLGGSPTPAVRRRGLSEKSVWNIHICLRAALYDAVNADPPLLRRNPAAGAMREPDGDREILTWTREELGAFLAFVADERDFALWWVAAYTGMRRGELLGLRWSDVKWNLRSISVQQQLSLDANDDGELDLAPVKTRNGRRAIGVFEDTLRVLRDHQAAQEFERRSWGEAYRTDLDLVFRRPDGTPEDPDTITHRFERAVERTGAKAIGGPHALRHTHATLLLESGVDISVVSKRLGHANVKITADRYAHVTARLQGDAAAKFSAYLLGPGIENPAASERSVSDPDSAMTT
jgi:integrase